MRMDFLDTGASENEKNSRDWDAGVEGRDIENVEIKRAPRPGRGALTSSNKDGLY
jgi:hypothetical protein